jgi:hypothetical protein
MAYLDEKDEACAFSSVGHVKENIRSLIRVSLLNHTCSILVGFVDDVQLLTRPL